MPAKGQKRKQQIINTAKEMFIKNGFQSTHIGQVCEKLNIARGTVYQYFGNKREILYAVLDQVEESLDDILDVDDVRDFLKTNPSQKSVIKFISDLTAECCKIIIEEPIVMKLIFKDIVGIDKEVISRVNKFLEDVVNITKTSIDEIVKKGIYRKSLNPEITSMMLIGGIMFILYEYSRKSKEDMDKDIINIIVNNYLTGVMK